MACGGAPPPPVATAPPAPVVTAQAGDLVISHVTVVPMSSDERADQTVVVRGERIVAVAPAASVRVPAGAQVIDGKDHWLMPGLTDMHVHAWSETNLTLFVAAGVTMIRNMWGSAQQLTWRDEIAHGKRLGPTIVTAGPLIDGDPPIWPGSTVLTDPAAADGIVTEQKAAGYDFLKPYSNLSKPAYEALAAAGAKHGMLLEGHVPDSVGLLGVLAAKQRTVEHMGGWLPALVRDGVTLPEHASSVRVMRTLLPQLDDGKLPGLIAKTLAAGTWNCPTLVVLDRLAALDHLEALRPRVKWVEMIPPVMVSQWDPKQDFRLKRFTADDFAAFREVNARNARLVAQIVAGGAPILVGTDVGNPFVIPGAALHDEIELLVAAGVPRPRVMRAATADAAVFLGTPHEFGVIEVGARADLLLVATDPLRAPIALVPDGVIVRGTWQPRAALEAKLAEIAKANAAPPPSSKDRWDGVPPLAAAGKVVHEAHYDVAISGRPVGEERLAVTLDHGKRVVTSQMVMAFPERIDTAYTVGPSATALHVKSAAFNVDLTGTLAGGKLAVTGTDGTGTAVSMSAPVGKADVILGSGLGVGDAIVLADKLAKLKVGGTQTVTAVEVGYYPKPSVEAARYAFERKPNVDGHRVFAFKKAGAGPSQVFPGELAVDKDGFVITEALTAPFNLTLTRR